MRSALGAILLATTGLAAGIILPATPAAAQSKSFDIPGGSLADVLNGFAEQSGVQLLYNAGLTQGRSSAGLKGSFGVAEGLSRLLSGSGVTYRQTGAEIFTLELAPTADAGTVQLGAVRVEGQDGAAVATSPPRAVLGNLPPAYAGGQVATGGQLGFLGNRSVMDTPFNVTSYTSKTIADQQARSLADVLINDPSVRSTGPSGANGFVDYFQIRGFQVATADVTWNGLPGVLPEQLISADFLERVEVLKGAGGLLYGISRLGEIGGAINVVPKHAADEPLTSLTASYGTDTQFAGHVDIGRRFGSNNQWGVRFNGTIRGGDTAIDGSSDRLGAAILGLDYRGDRLRIAFDGGYQDRRMDGLFDTMAPGASDFQIPSPPGAGRNAFPDWSHFTASTVFGMARAEYDVAPDWTIFGAVGASRNKSTLLGLIELIENSAGDTLNFPRANESLTHNITGQIGVRGSFDLGSVHNQVALYGSYLHTRFGFYQSIFASEAGNLFDADALARPDLSGFSYRAPLSYINNHSSIAFADTASVLDGRIQLTFGGREQRIEVNNYNTSTGALSTHYDKSVFSPALGIVFKPIDKVSLYANYIEGLQQGPTAPSSAKNAGEVFPPYVSKQYEVGAKVDLGRVTSTLAFFQIKKPNGITDPTSLVFAVNDQQRNRGIEWNVFGEPVKGVRLIGGLSYIDGIQTETGDPLTDGKKAYGTPNVQLNLGGEWDTPFIPGLTFTGRVVYTSSQYLDSQESQTIPHWTRVDLGARYVLNLPDVKPVTIRADVFNVANKSYWEAYTFANSLTESSPRRFMLSATFDF